ncbi:MAG: ribonuclease P protein component [Eubacteriales bacterium]|nr:ribonuclease P protein component [Eubacteriales bacterium]
MEGKKGAAASSQGFPRRYRLGANRNYRYVYRKGKSYPSRNLVLVYLKGKELRIGFSVSSKVGNAVARNRIRRILREDVRRMRDRLKCGKYILVARTSIVNVPHMEITQEVRSLLARAKLLKEEC